MASETIRPLSPYWIMDGEPLTNDNGEALLLVHNDLELGDVWSWKSGARFTEDEANFTLPIRVEFERRRGYAGPIVDLVDVGVPLMSARLLDALHRAGVDNLDVYPVELVSRDGAESHPCFAYNVIGRVEAVDLGKSITFNTDGGRPVSNLSVEELVLNEGAIVQLKLFRLSENVNAIIVADAVRQVVEASGIGSLTFTAPQDWVQL
jgi:hypothetical protein